MTPNHTMCLQSVIWVIFPSLELEFLLFIATKERNMNPSSKKCIVGMTPPPHHPLALPPRPPCVFSLFCFNCNLSERRPQTLWLQQKKGAALRPFAERLWPAPFLIPYFSHPVTSSHFILSANIPRFPLMLIIPADDGADSNTSWNPLAHPLHSLWWQRGTVHVKKKPNYFLSRWYTSCILKYIHCQK